MVSEIDGLSIHLDADFSDLDRAFRDLDQTMGTVAADVDATLGDAFETVGRRIEGSLRDFLAGGEVSLENLKDTALSVADEIIAAFLRMGTEELGLGGLFDPYGGLGGLILSSGGLLGGLFGRAGGGPVAAGMPYVVGESGPELFVPQQTGRVVNGGARAAAPHVTVNVYGTSTGPEIRQSAGQVAAAVASTLKRAQRNL